jgi:hypothetical protein
MEKKDQKIFRLNCPCCHALLWIDPSTQEVIKSEKGKKKKGTLDDLLLKEKKKRDGVERKFDTTAELAKEKKKAAEDEFTKAFGRLDEEE